jgi:nicotinamide phosphoribosyltransferase
MNENIITKTDSYKVTHHLQYPPNAMRVYSFLESRGGVLPTTCFFGLQYVLDRHLTGRVVTQEDVTEARVFCEDHLGGNDYLNVEGWDYIARHHEGYLPLEIKAVDEGTVVPNSNVLMTVENTDPRVPWLTNYVETLLTQVWYPTTVATLSRENRRSILGFLELTGTPEDVDFKLHDFGYRGSTSHESAGIGGAAHLVNFKGTDTMAALTLLRRYYSERMAGFSIPAAEHSTITAWGENNEGTAFANMLAEFPTGLVAVVSDSYDIYAACENLWGDTLYAEVMGRDGTLVIRPDSGDPVEVVLRVLDILWRKFGGVTNEKGYRVLDPHVRIIQGDGIDPDMIMDILCEMTGQRWSADNIAFGSGGGLLQKDINRDTFRFAFKASAIEIGSHGASMWHDVWKAPVTDPGKQSKPGRMKLIQEDGEYRTVGIDHPGDDHLHTVFLNGCLHRSTAFSAIRERAKV